MGTRARRVLEDTMYWVQRAVADGAPVTGYMYWSLTDNYEWGSYAPRFGLYTVDVTTDPTLARRPTAAVAAYRALIRNRGVPVDYRPAKSSSVRRSRALVVRSVVCAATEHAQDVRGSEGNVRAAHKRAVRSAR